MLRLAPRRSPAGPEPPPRVLLPVCARSVRQHTGKHINARCRNRVPARVRGLLDRCRSGDRAIIQRHDKITITAYVSFLLLSSEPDLAEPIGAGLGVPLRVLHRDV